MAKIQVRQGESIESALRRFNNDVMRDGILLELQKRQFYQKPSLVKKLKEKERIGRGNAGRLRNTAS